MKFEIEMLKLMLGNEGDKFEVIRTWEASVVEPYMLKELIDQMPKGRAIQILKVED